MFKKLLFLSVTLLLSACGPKVPDAKVIDSGIYGATVLVSGNWKFGIPVTISSISDLKHQQTVTRVPAEDGRYWGFRAKLTNPLKERSVVCRHTVEHPEFTSPDGTKSSMTSQEFEVPPAESVETDFLWFFIEGCEHEFAPGTWTHRVFLDGREVIRKDFEIYQP